MTKPGAPRIWLALTTTYVEGTVVKKKKNILKVRKKNKLSDFLNVTQLKKHWSWAWDQGKQCLLNALDEAWLSTDISLHCF